MRLLSPVTAALAVTWTSASVLGDESARRDDPAELSEACPDYKEYAENPQ